MDQDIAQWVIFNKKIQKDISDIMISIFNFKNGMKTKVLRIFKSDCIEENIGTQWKIRETIEIG